MTTKTMGYAITVSMTADSTLVIFFLLISYSEKCNDSVSDYRLLRWLKLLMILKFFERADDAIIYKHIRGT